MAEKFSTGLRNAMLGKDCLRRLMADMVMDIYSGSVPSDADQAVGATKLVRVTKASGVVDPTEKSTAKQAHVNITVAGLGATIIVAINGVDYTCTVTASEGNLRLVAAKTALMLDAIDVIRAIAVASAAGDGALVVQSKIPGLTFTIAKGAGGGGGTATWTITDDTIANVRSDALQLGAPSAGSISKEVGPDWTGANLATGTASFVRWVLPDDLGDLSTTAIRIQGAVGTGGAELNLYSMNFVKDAITRINGGSINLPVG